MDEVKKYLRERRDELDVEPLPGDHVWQYIEKNTRPAKKTPVVRLAAKLMVAAAVIMIVAGIAYFYMRHPSPGEEVAVVPAAKEPISKVQHDLPVPSNDSIDREIPNQNKETTIPAPERNVIEKKLRKTKHAEVKAKPPVESMEENYASIINYRLNRVNSTPIYAENAGYFHSFKKQWQQLQKDEQSMMQDMQQAGLSDNMIDKLIILYQQKLLLLKQLQTEINKMNNRVTKNPSARRHEPSFMNL